MDGHVAKLIGVGALLLASACSGTSKQSTSSPTPTGGVSASPTRSAQDAKGASGKPTIADVTFKGDLSKPVISVKGASFGVSPTPNPPHTMGGHSPCPATQGNQGLDYGSQLYIEDQSRKWSAGRYRSGANALDCVGLVVTAFTPPEVVFQLGSAYTDSPDKYRLQEGDSFTLVVEGSTYQGKVHYSS